MICCTKCGRVLGAIRESEEIDVIGEIHLLLLCNYCNEPNDIALYEYNKKRMNKRKNKVLKRGVNS